MPLFLAPEEYAAALAALRRETAEAGRDPERRQAGVVVFAAVGDDDRAPAEGAPVALAPLPAARQGLPAAPGGRLARDLRCRPGPLRRSAGARHIVVMVAGSPAVEQFGALRAAFAGREPRALAGTPA